MSTQDGYNPEPDKNDNKEKGNYDINQIITENDI